MYEAPSFPSTITIISIITYTHTHTHLHTHTQGDKMYASGLVFEERGEEAVPEVDAWDDSAILKVCVCVYICVCVIIRGGREGGGVPG